MESAAPVAGRAAEQTWEDVATFRFLVDRIREAAEAGVLQVDEVEDAALTIWAQVHGLVSLYLAGKLAMERNTFERVFAGAIDNLKRAFGWTGDRPPRRPRR